MGGPDGSAGRELEIGGGEKSQSALLALLAGGEGLCDEGVATVSRCGSQG